ncbi:lysophospholipid acyltransferase family protein [Paraburkholderia sp. SOS3]|uniref:lysophospholipid acyltransferase family protein n=1 Tax=Paraburkholderia sp. SOS3 TaxID=1926494 RepID=UPI00094741BB|nr:lysophospholipid acyltransferase family protein [Paraburkholderia sp. SOS3]APR35203.1 1-acyl-sn-glycerol-3-phosphate acyltransferase [Paraburkholderia sp. SOS3]
MKLALRKLRLVAHLLYGMWVVATRFSRVTPQQRFELNRAWSLRFLQLAGMRLVVHNDAARIDEGALVVSNHISWIDIYVINAWRPTRFVSKAEVRKWPVVGWLAFKLDTVFLQREKRSDAKRIMHELADHLIAGHAICVFPEGTTTDGRELLPFHSNLFQAAVSASRPVQPICIYYEDAHGNQSTAPAYIDDMSLGESMHALLCGAPLTAHVYVCDALAPGAERRVLAAEAQAAVEAALERLRPAGSRVREALRTQPVQQAQGVDHDDVSNAGDVPTTNGPLAQ